MSCLESQRCHLRLQGQNQLFLLAFCWEVPEYVAFPAQNLAVPLGDDSPGTSPITLEGLGKLLPGLVGLLEHFFSWRAPKWNDPLSFIPFGLLNSFS